MPARIDRDFSPFDHNGECPACRAFDEVFRKGYLGKTLDDS